ncbi:protein of unknown function [Bradyrhizobium sp. ORS 285]|nr:hypothetical protein BRAO285_1850034 [Bradyrhizobium sp. ORS 285]SMX56133.1 protein of unknown function [Bradyrhizobium sp. ORS 285]
MSLPIDFDREEDPKPRSDPFIYVPARWPVQRIWQAIRPAPPPAADFAGVIRARQSVRVITRAPLRETVNFLMYAHGRRYTWGDNPPRFSGASHSAGALHPLDLLLISGSLRNRVFRIDPATSSLQLLTIARLDPLRALNTKLRGMFPDATSDYIVLLADQLLTSSQYSSARTLIWRDAGALMQTLHLCATAFRMAFCPAGIGGSEIRDALFAMDDRFEGVGVAVLGRTI